MIVQCPRKECQWRNRFVEPLRPEGRYRCGRCRRTTWRAIIALGGQLELRLESESPAPSRHDWIPRVTRYIAVGRQSRGLKLLERVIEADLPLFAGQPELLE